MRGCRIELGLMGKSTCCINRKAWVQIPNVHIKTNKNRMWSKTPSMLEVETDLWSLLADTSDSVRGPVLRE